MDQELIDALKQQHIGLRDTNIEQALAQGEPIQVADLREGAPSAVNDVILRAGFRALLVAPLLRGEDVVGMLVVRRKTPGTFPQNTVDLIKTFAAQSVLAILNARLFKNVEARTGELARSLEDLRTAQDRLVQTEKLASLGQLTAGIAHEIKNPLNFVNNFSAVSVELIDELREALGGAHLDSKLRAEISEIADTLQGNLGKVVQHGKRADAIVKNMLLHSRQGSGEHRPVDINALVDESLNLAYHGARAGRRRDPRKVMEISSTRVRELDVALARLPQGVHPDIAAEHQLLQILKDLPRDRAWWVARTVVRYQDAQFHMSQLPADREQRADVPISELVAVPEAVRRAAVSMESYYAGRET